MPVACLNCLLADYDDDPTSVVVAVAGVVVVVGANDHDEKRGSDEMTQ